MSKTSKQHRIIIKKKPTHIPMQNPRINDLVTNSAGSLQVNRETTSFSKNPKKKHHHETSLQHNGRKGTIIIQPIVSKSVPRITAVIMAIDESNKQQVHHHRILHRVYVKLRNPSYTNSGENLHLYRYEIFVCLHYIAAIHHGLNGIPFRDLP